MKRIVAATIWVVLASVLAACGGRAAGHSAAAPGDGGAVPAFAASMKGWELYTWQEGGGSYYSLMVGTNATKTWAQIAGKASDDPRLGATRLAGTQALELALARLPKGEQISWVRPGAPSVDGDAQAKLAAPADDVQKQVTAMCAALGLTVN